MFFFEKCKNIFNNIIDILYDREIMMILSAGGVPNYAHRYPY